jgi:hypothetical protein
LRIAVAPSRHVQPTLLFRSFDMTHLHLKNMVLAASLALNLAAG